MYNKFIVIVVQNLLKHTSLLRYILKLTKPKQYLRDLTIQGRLCQERNSFQTGILQLHSSN